MNLDEFAFFNQQLAGMLQSGIPLEGAVHQLTKGMRRGVLRSELELLQHDLEAGLPLTRALEQRRLPELYVAVLRAGGETGNLPAILVLLADYYGRLHSTTTRLKGLMVYPAIVLAAAFALSLALSLIFTGLFREATDVFFTTVPQVGPFNILVWVLPLLLLLGLVALGFAFANHRVRRWMRWHLPAAKEASLAQAASTLSILLSSGTTFATALNLLEKVEKNTVAGSDLARWRAALEQGKSRFSDIAVVNRAFPPLFVWIVSQGGENLAAGFQRAADIFSDRASAKTDTLLYAALPMAVLVLGLFILGQMVSAVGLVSQLIDSF